MRQSWTDRRRDFGIGYAVGCLISILLWRIDRQKVFRRVNSVLEVFFGSKIIKQIFIIFIITLVCYFLQKIKYEEIYNIIAAFLVIDVSNSERKNIKKRDRKYFYNSISIISRSLVCGFVGPLLYILILGNTIGIAYMLVYNFSLYKGNDIIKAFGIITTIIPAMITEIFLMLVYFCRSKSFNVDFRGDYIANTLRFPLLNIDILAAYIESVNFYYYYDYKDVHYLKSYGRYSNKINGYCVKDYLSISYGICIVFFFIFFILIVK